MHWLYFQVHGYFYAVSDSYRIASIHWDYPCDSYLCMTNDFLLLEILPIDWRRVYFEAWWCCKYIKMLGRCLTYSKQPSKFERTASDREGKIMLFHHMCNYLGAVFELWLPDLCFIFNLWGDVIFKFKSKILEILVWIWNVQKDLCNLELRFWCLMLTII